MPEGAFTLGRYDCLCLLGRGGMAEVWAARARGARGFQKLVALKMLLPAMLDDPSCERMFLEEASVASRIQHPNAVEVMDLGEEQGRLFIAMEYVDGASLAALSRVAKLPLPLPVAIEIVAAACFGLHAAHELKDENGAPLGVVHRDVSPHNILLARDGSVKVADFGIAKAMAKSSGTDIGVVKGKLSYMAPEQACGEKLDRRADVFALGVVLYELTTGVHPFRGESPEQTGRQLLHGEWRPPRDLAGEQYPLELQELVLRAMAPKAADRPATALELGSALRALELEPEPGTAPVALTDLVQRYLGPELERREQVIRGAAAPPPRAEPGATPRTPEAATVSALPPTKNKLSLPPRARLAWLAGGLAVALFGVMSAWAYSASRGARSDAHPLRDEQLVESKLAVAAAATSANRAAVAEAAATVAPSPPLVPAVSASAEPRAPLKASRAQPRSKANKANPTAPAAPRSFTPRNVPVRDPGF